MSSSMRTPAMYDFPPPVFEDRNVLLHHGVDVEEDGHVVAGQQPDVGAMFPVLVEADDLLDRGGLRLADGLAGAEWGARDLEQSAVVAVPDHADLGRHALLDVDRIAIAHLLRAVQRQVRLPLNLIDSAEDDAARLVLDLDELVALDRIYDRTTERRRAHIAVDDADKSVAVMGSGPRMSGGLHACIPCEAR